MAVPKMKFSTYIWRGPKLGVINVNMGQFITIKNSSLFLMLLVLCLALSISTTSSCKRAQGLSGQSEQNGVLNDTLMVLQKAPCFGKCPVYSAAFLRNGTLVFKPSQNADFLKPGKYKLSEGFLSGVEDLMTLGQWDTLSAEYPIAPDFPTTTITTYTAKGRKQVTVAAYAPDAVTQLLNFTEQELQKHKGESPSK